MKRKNNPRRDADGTMAWQQLTKGERERFEKAFTRYQAMVARQKLVFESKETDDPYMALLLSEVEHESRKRDYVEGQKPQDCAIANQCDANLEKLGGEINRIIARWMTYGRWDRFRWLADYGTEYCKSGWILSKDLYTELETPQKFRTFEGFMEKIGQKFPKLEQILQKGLSGKTLRDIVLLEFVVLADCDLEMIYKVYACEEGQEYARLPEKYSPPRIPTIKKLRESVRDSWEQLGKMPYGIDSDFSKALKELGLDGLPNGSRETPT